MGTLVSSPFVGKDEFNIEGCFFTFPGLSVRTPRKYSLRFSLIILDIQSMRQGARRLGRAVIKSEPFNVFNTKAFGGMRASTELTKRLKHQGCLISVKRGNVKPNEASDDDQEEVDKDSDDDMTKSPWAWLYSGSWL
jgi:hypothetical protein